MNEDAYRDGFSARLEGKETDANPYRRLSEAWLSWADGWKDQDEHLNARDVALDSLGWFG